MARSAAAVRGFVERPAGPRVREARVVSERPATRVQGFAQRRGPARIRTASPTRVQGFVSRADDGAVTCFDPAGRNNLGGSRQIRTFFEQFSSTSN